MNAAVESPRAWEPFTPRGVAAFARARLSRLLLVQFVVASLAAVAVVELLASRCFPTVRAAIRNLPDTGAIDSGRLDWSGPAPQLLASGRLLAVVVDPGHSGQLPPAADVQVEFGRETVRLYSFLGYAEWRYPPEYRIAFNRLELGPLWDAWEPEWLGIILLVVVVGLMLLWALLATIYFLPAWLAGFLTNRDLNLSGSWKLAGAALMPGALLLAGAMVLYGWGALNLIHFCLLFCLHLVLAWVYLLCSQFFLPRLGPTPAKGNPFNPPPLH